jgi:uncharacterized protein (DUF362 family)
VKDSITRRRFIARTAAAGASVTLGGGLFGGLVPPLGANEGRAVGLAAATGPDGFANTLAAVEAVGGMARFVPKGARVLVNANTAFKHRGSIVSPDVLLAVLDLCAEAGAAEVRLVKKVPENYWARSERAAAHQHIIDGAAVSEREFEVVPIPAGVALREAHVDRRLLAADVVLNVAIAKHHRGCDYSGALKNAMGPCAHRPTCRFFHVGANPGTNEWYPNPRHLAQCIADVQLVRRPDLCVLDAGEVLTSNGPAGPGELADRQVVVASADPVAIDAYGVRFLGLEPAAVPMIGMAAAHGVGSDDLVGVGVLERGPG